MPDKRTDKWRKLYKGKRLTHLNRIAAELEESILGGRGDVEAMRREWRECQNEMLEIEGAIDSRVLKGGA